MAITDQIWEHIIYDGAEHIPIATIPGMHERSYVLLVDNPARYLFPPTGG